MLARVQAMHADNATLQALVREACLAELRALKPGNISAHALSHAGSDAKLTVQAFELSAQVIAKPLVMPEQQSVGERVLSATIATQSAVSTNTNTGIILLLSPLIYARQLKLPAQSIRDSLHTVLKGLSVRDAVLAYEAIRIAKPGGLGDASSQDVKGEPSVTLLQAMQLAAQRDAIARAYCDDFAAVFEIGLPVLQAHEPSPWATTLCYLRLLSLQRDSLVERKFGSACAQATSTRAESFYSHAMQAHDTQSRAAVEVELAEWDAELKRAGHNPGTTADFTVACLFAQALEAQESYS